MGGRAGPVRNGPSRGSAAAPGRARLGRLDGRVPGHGHRNGQAHARGTGGPQVPLDRPGRCGGGIHRPAVPDSRTGGPVRHRRTSPRGPAGRRDRALPAFVGRQPHLSRPLPRDRVLSRTGAGRRRARGEHRTGPGPAGAPRPPRQARPGGCRPYRPVQPPTAGPGPGGHHGGGAPVLDLRSGARTLSADSGLVGRDPTPPVELDRRIAERFDRLMELGFLEEVRSLAARPGGLSRTARQALGYRELLTHLEEGVPLPDAVDQAVRRTRAFARRQMAWFRRDPRIVWLERDTDPVATIAALFREIPRDGAGMGDCPTAP